MHADSPDAALRAVLTAHSAPHLQLQGQELHHQKQQLTAVATRAAVMAANGTKAGGSLAALLEELGYAATADETAARKVVGATGDLSPATIARALTLLARTREGLKADARGSAASLAAALGGLSLDSGAQGWNADELVDAIKVIVQQAQCRLSIQTILLL